MEARPCGKEAIGLFEKNNMPFDDIEDLGDSIHLWTIPLDGPAAGRGQ